MTALTKSLSVPETLPEALKVKFNILNDAIIFAGAILAVDYLGEIQNAADTAGLVVVGRAPLSVDNKDDGETMTPERGIYRYLNDATYPLTRFNIGQPCYVVDNATVGSRSTNYESAGIVFDVDASGVWVDQRPMALKLAKDLTPPLYAAKTDSYDMSAAQALAFSRRLVMTMDKASIATLTLPSAVAGMKVGISRVSVTAAHDIKVQAATGDKVQGSDGYSAASKCVDNTVDLVSVAPIYFEAVDATHWAIVSPQPHDVGAWVLNNA